ncbi:hypothetical protein BSZ39_02820 [Bowdeniella nasicola]|uniref:cysteine-S-conjugate beta-lyase n=1 Tax=Bowdeniella nasicola TaxID=208480 RepID=A0A1Q5Q499_9ACTO|nr:aminotransferase class I/II-fold pyridoxal phosphate-dependent enzyme [Bowdeniella nasicola]OKL54637.1 hypothetical protein BSZ39_02820 [Bowdeniella nasicola]
MTSRYFPDFSEFSADRLRERGSLKWSTYPDAIGTWVAEMDFGISPAIAATIQRAATDGAFGYLIPADKAAMQDASAEWLGRRYGWEVPPETVFVYPDVVAVLESVLEHVLQPGLPVVIPTPTYMPFLSHPALLKRAIIQVPSRVGPDGRYSLDLAGIEAALKPRGGLLIVCNPWNPVGRVLTRKELEDIERIVIATGARVFADEVHGPVVLDEDRRHIPYASISPIAASHTITGTSTSKGFNIPGLKCAQGIVTSEADRAALAAWAEHYEELASPLGVKCTVVAYRDSDDWLAEVLDVLRANRDLFARELSKALPNAGHYPTEGTFLAWIDLRPYGITAPGEFALQQAKVAAIDGANCGSPGHLRVNLAMSPDNVMELVRRLAAAITGESRGS